MCGGGSDRFHEKQSLPKLASVFILSPLQTFSYALEFWNIIDQSYPWGIGLRDSGGCLKLKVVLNSIYACTVFLNSLCIHIYSNVWFIN